MLVKKNFHDDNESLKKIIAVANTDEIIELDDHSHVKVDCPRLTDALKVQILETTGETNVLSFCCFSASTSSNELSVEKGLFSYERFKFNLRTGQYSGFLSIGPGEEGIEDFQIIFKPPFDECQKFSTVEELQTIPGIRIEKGKRCTIL